MLNFSAAALLAIVAMQAQAADIILRSPTKAGDSPHTGVVGQVDKEFTPK